MSLFSRLFGGSGGGSKAEAEPEHYEGFAITPAPVRDGNTWRIGARIEKDGRIHDLIRADTFSDQGDASAASIGKAKQMIDQMGDGLFG